MSITAYRSEQRISYSNEPTSYFGWYFSADAPVNLHNFHSQAAQEAFVEAVRQVGGLDPQDADDVAAYLAVATWGDADADQEFGRISLEEVLDRMDRSERGEWLKKLAGDWDDFDRQEVPADRIEALLAEMRDEGIAAASPTLRDVAGSAVAGLER